MDLADECTPLAARVLRVLLARESVFLVGAHGQATVGLALVSTAALIERAGGAVRWGLAGSAVQLVIVAGVHYFSAGRLVGGIARMAVSLAFGAAYGIGDAPNRRKAASGGAGIGIVCGLVATAAGVLLGDLDSKALLFGTSSSMMAGLAGGGLGRFLRGSRRDGDR